MEAQLVAEGISLFERLRRIKDIIADPEVRTAGKAAFRTLANAGITVGEMIPGIGELGSWAADAGKLAASASKRLRGLDLTPDVSKTIAIGSELVLEPVSGGLLPTHVIEGSLQLRADWPRLKAGYEKVRNIWQGRQKELASPEVQEAMSVFEE